MEEEVTRVHAHKTLMMDFLFTEMEEHSKKLQMYADFYDYFQRGISVDKEFTQIMQGASSFFPALKDSDKFLQHKQRG